MSITWIISFFDSSGTDKFLSGLIDGPGMLSKPSSSSSEEISSFRCALFGWIPRFVVDFLLLLNFLTWKLINGYIWPTSWVGTGQSGGKKIMQYIQYPYLAKGSAFFYFVRKSPGIYKVGAWPQEPNGERFATCLSN